MRKLHLFVGIVLVLLALSAQALTYTVTITNDSGPGSLRAAILNANANPGRDVIFFQVPTWGSPITLQVTNGLPAITECVLIDGRTQVFGAACPPAVELDGSLAGNYDGLVLMNVTNCEIRGLVINRFAYNGILMGGGGKNQIYGNYIGTTADGQADAGNGLHGIWITSSTNNHIGLQPTDSCTNRNIISGNGRNGVYLHNGSIQNGLANNYIGTDVDGSEAIPNDWNGVTLDAAGDNDVGGVMGPKPVNVISANRTNGVFMLNIGASSNRVYGNYIGTDVTGSNTLGNGEDGVHIRGVGTNYVGNTDVNTRNVISGNKDDGVEVRELGAMRNCIRANYIGTDSSGALPLGNRDNGVEIFSQAIANDIGGATPAERNIISGNEACGIRIGGASWANGIYGNYIGLDAAGLNAVRNWRHGVFITGDGFQNYLGDLFTPGNYISGNGTNSDCHGVYITGSDDCRLMDNVIGLNIANVAVSNAGDGIRIEDSMLTAVGWPGEEEVNVISGNGGSGIHMGPHADRSWVCGSIIGLDTNGTTARPNSGEGIYVYQSATNTIGETNGMNIISGNQGSGIKIEDPQSRDNIVINNDIGTDITGSGALGNSDHGVYILNSPSNTIGTGAGRNVISGNDLDGIRVEGEDSVGNTIQNNLIGLSADGLSSLGNGDSGVFCTMGPSQTQIGGTNNLGNVIAGNGDHGVFFFWDTTRDNFVQGNLIGMNAAGEPVGSGQIGVYALISSDNTIGGANTNLGNRIAFSLQSGVQVNGGSNNLIRGNSIYSNAMLGIDLGNDGVTANDLFDPDLGANMFQNYPRILSATTNAAADLVFSYDFNSVTGQTYELEFFINDSADPFGYGEGQYFLYHTNHFTASGLFTFYNKTIGATVRAGQFVTATMTDPFGNSSEFSEAIEIVPNHLFDADGDGMPDVWEDPRGLSPYNPIGANGARGDPDTDEVENYDEYVADTDPQDPTNYLHFVQIDHTHDTMLIYTSTNTRYYEVSYTTNLFDADPVWMDLYVPAVQGANGTSWTNDPSGSTNRFYRVEVQLQL